MKRIISFNSREVKEDIDYVYGKGEKLMHRYYGSKFNRISQPKATV